MPKLKINNQEIEVAEGLTVLQACEIAGIEIPRFCYHPRLNIAGNCRMCLVEMEKSPKPIASCAMPVSENMSIHTDTELVKKAREGVMEFLLINHPLDCPICDQGGECDLQDQAMAYGKGSNRFALNKRTVEDKYMGPLIKTHMTRCIHCTRCIRFATEIAGVPELGGIGRGEHMEVGTYVGKAISSELSGNMIDICPVGALTSKPYAFKARSWELKKTESIDVLDAVGSNIRVDSRGMQVMRILPRLNEDINEEWISDKTRFSYDGLYVQRLDRPMVRKMGKLTHVSWTEAFAAIKETMGNLNPAQVGALVGDLADAESIFALKDLMDKVGVDNLDCRQNHVKLDHKHRVSYLFNSTIAGIEKSDLCILVGANPRYEATMINARLRKRFLAGHFEIAAIGKIDDLTYPVRDLGDDLAVLDKLLDESHLFSEKLKQAKNPMIIIGETVLARDDGDAILAKCKQLSDKFGIVREGWNGFNILHTAASRVAALDLGFVPSNKGYNTKEILEATRSGDIKLLYLLGADEIDIEKLGSSFVIYQGHHGDRAAHRADVILPGAAYTEKNATYVNLEGRVQRTYIATPPPGEAKEDWQIIKLVADSLGYNLSYNNIDSLRQKMVEYAPHFAAVGKITPAKWVDFIESKNKVLDQKLDATSKNYYMTNPISRASKIMAECIKVIWKKEEVV